MIIAWVADVGKVEENFGWGRIPEQPDNFVHPGGGIFKFTAGIANDLNAGNKVALGFECPLFLPVAKEALALTSARNGEGNRPWSCGAGCTSLAVGMVESVWIFERIKQLTTTQIIPTLNWKEFHSGSANFFIWEAFVTGNSKTITHNGDAEKAAETFWANYPNIEGANSITVEHPYSLIGAGLLRSGLSNDIGFLTQPCVTIKA